MSNIILILENTAGNAWTMRDANSDFLPGGTRVVQCVTGHGPLFPGRHRMEIDALAAAAGDRITTASTRINLLKPQDHWWLGKDFVPCDRDGWAEDAQEYGLDDELTPHGLVATALLTPEIRSKLSGLARRQGGLWLRGALENMDPYVTREIVAA